MRAYLCRHFIHKDFLIFFLSKIVNERSFIQQLQLLQFHLKLFNKYSLVYNKLNKDTILICLFFSTVLIYLKIILNLMILNFI